jgi:hypothetical protein
MDTYYGRSGHDEKKVSDSLLIAKARVAQVFGPPAPEFFEKSFNIFGGKLQAKPEGRNSSGKFTWALTLSHPTTGQTYTLNIHLSRQITEKDLASNTRIFAYFKSKIEAQSLAWSRAVKGHTQAVTSARNSFLNTYHALIGELRKPKPDATTLDQLAKELAGRKSTLDAVSRSATSAGVPIDNDAHFSYMLAVPYSEFGARLDSLQRVASAASWNAQVRDNFFLGLFNKVDQTATGLLTTSVQGYQLLWDSIANGQLLEAGKTLVNPAAGGPMIAGLSEDAKNFVVQWLKNDWQTLKKIAEVPGMTAGQRGEWAFDMAMVALDIYTLGTGASMVRKAGISSKIVTRAELRLGRKLTKLEKNVVAEGVNTGKGPAAYGKVLRDDKMGKVNTPVVAVPQQPTNQSPNQPPDAATPAPPRPPARPTLTQLFESAKNPRSLTINPVEGNPFRLEIRDLNGKHYVRLPDGKVMEFGEQVFLNRALKHRFSDKNSVVATPKKVVPLMPEQAFKAGTNARYLRVKTANEPIKLALRDFQGKIYVSTPEGILVFKRPQANLNAVLQGRFRDFAESLKQGPRSKRSLSPGKESIQRVNPNTNAVSNASITASKSIAYMSAAELKEAATFLASINPSSYPTLGSAFKALKKADQLYLMRDAQGAIRGMATLTKDSPHSWYLGQVAGPRGFGGDIMTRMLGDFEQLAKNQRAPLRIHAYTNKPGNIYDASNPNGEGFYAKLGAKIKDPNPEGFRDLVTERRIDFEWNFSSKAPKPQIQASIGFPSPLPPLANVRVPSNFVQQGVTTIAAIIDNPLRPFLIPQGVFFAANKSAKAIAPHLAPIANLATTTIKRILSLPKAIFDKLPANAQIKIKEIATGQKATTMSEAALKALPPEVQAKMRNMIVVDEATWILIPEDIKLAMDVASQQKIAVLQAGAAPRSLAGAVEWSVAGVKGGTEKLTSFVATASNRLWNSPVINIPMNTSKVLGFVANKGVNALMILEMTTGGPKIHFYNPTSSAAITGPSIEALKMAYVPLADGTVAVTLQSKLVPQASVTFWKSGPTMRNGIPRIDGRLSTAGDESLVRIISTWQANAGMVGVFTKVGVPNYHFLNGISFRPFGEFGTNPLAGQSVIPVKGAGLPGIDAPLPALQATTFAAISPPGMASTISTARISYVAFTSERGTLNLGPGTRFTVPGSATGSGLMTLPTAKALQTNPALSLLDPFSPNAYSPPTTSPNSSSFISAEGALPSSGAANQAIYRLAIDPGSGWMSLLPNSERSALMIKPDIANAMKIAAVKNGKIIRTDFQNLYQFKSYDLVRALQSPTGVSAFKRALRESLGTADLIQPLTVDAFAKRFSDPISREFIKTNPQFCLDLIR